MTCFMKSPAIPQDSLSHRHVAGCPDGNDGGDAAYLASVLPEKGRCALDVPGGMIHIK
jgi:hypothetical protein